MFISLEVFQGEIQELEVIAILCSTFGIDL